MARAVRRAAGDARSRRRAVDAPCGEWVADAVAKSRLSRPQGLFDFAAPQRAAPPAGAAASAPIDERREPPRRAGGQEPSRKVFAVGELVRGGGAHRRGALRPGVGRGRDLEPLGAALGPPLLHAQGRRGAAAVGDVPLAGGAAQVRARRRAEGARARAAARSTRRRASSSSTSTRSSRRAWARCSWRSSSSRRSWPPRGCSTSRASGRCRAWPRRIGIVTSPTGAAVRDIIRIAERRGRMRFLVVAVPGAGRDGAPFEIIRALRRARAAAGRRRDHRRRAAAARPKIWRRSTTRRWRAPSPPAACRW